MSTADEPRSAAHDGPTPTRGGGAMIDTTTAARPSRPERVAARCPADIEALARELLGRGLVPDIVETIAAETLIRRGWVNDDAYTTAEALLRRAVLPRPGAESPPPPTPEEVRAAFEMVKRTSSVEWVPIALTFADRYQRQLSDVKIRDYERRGFAPHGLNTVVLSLRGADAPRDGLYAIVDGGHRIELARRQGWPEIHANVLRDLTYEEEADLFGVLNYRMPVSALAKFNARLERREETAVAIRDILAEFDLRIGKSINLSTGVVNAVDAVDRLYADMGPVGLFQVFAILHAAWGREPGAYHGSILDGTKQFWLRYHRVADPIRLADLLKQFAPETVVRHASNNSGAAGTRIGKELVTIYNRRLKSSKLRDWVEHPGRTLTLARDYTQIPFTLRSYRSGAGAP